MAEFQSSPSSKTAYGSGSVGLPAGVKGQQRVPPPTNKVTKEKRREGTDGLPVKANFSKGINGVLKQMHPGFSLDKGTMQSVNSILNDVFHKIAMEAGLLAQRSGKKTMGTKDIQNAVKVIFGGDELTTHAIMEGNHALAKYEQSLRDDREEAHGDLLDTI